MGDRKHALLQFFSFIHLPAPLREVSQEFSQLAHWVDLSLPDGAEKSVCLRKLLEAKDCAVRARLHRQPTADEPE